MFTDLTAVTVFTEALYLLVFTDLTAVTVFTLALLLFVFTDFTAFTVATYALAFFVFTERTAVTVATSALALFVFTDLTAVTVFTGVLWPVVGAYPAPTAFLTPIPAAVVLADAGPFVYATKLVNFIPGNTKAFRFACSLGFFRGFRSCSRLMIYYVLHF